MSWQATAWVSTVEAGGPSGKLLLYALANYADENGRCYPGDERIMRDTELSERSVRDWKRRLEEAGLMRIERRRKPGGDFDIDMIHLAMDGAQPPANSAGGATGKSCTDHRQMAPSPPANGSNPPAPPYKAEPSVEPPIEPSERGREREVEKTEAEKRRGAERWLKRHFTSWPGYAYQSEAKALKAALALTAEERAAAVDRMAEYLEGEKKAGGECVYGVYLAEKRWEKLGPKGSGAARPTVAPPWGPDWAQLLFVALLAEPIDPGPVEMTREKRLAAFETMRTMLGADKAEAHYRRMGHEITADGVLIFPDDFEARIAREHLQAKGWPRANDLLRAAGEGKVTRLDARFEPRRELLEPVPVGLSRWREWHEEFARRGWPPMPDPGRQPVVFFPVGGPEMLATFELAVRGGNDAGRSEAAE